MHLHPEAIHLSADALDAIRDLLEMARQRIKLVRSDVPEQTADCLAEIECEVEDHLARLADARRWDADDEIEADLTAAEIAWEARQPPEMLYDRGMRRSGV